MENNRFLLDTHIFIWWMERNKRLKRKTLSLLNNPKAQIFLSTISIWEMLIKAGKNKLEIDTDIEDGVRRSGFTILPLTISHVLKVKSLPPHHNDPFDRILIAQAQSENLTFITDDKKMERYNVTLFS